MPLLQVKAFLSLFIFHVSLPFFEMLFMLAGALEHNLFLCLFGPTFQFALLAETWGPLSLFFLPPLCWVLCLMELGKA
jgi:hypothetical protein